MSITIKSEKGSQIITPARAKKLIKVLQRTGIVAGVAFLIFWPVGGYFLDNPAHSGWLWFAIPYGAYAIIGFIAWCMWLTDRAEGR